MNEFIVIERSEWDQLRKDVKAINALVAELKTALKPELEIFLTTDEACEKYSVSKSTLNKYKKAGHIKTWQVGRVVRWPQSQIDKFFKQKP